MLFRSRGFGVADAQIATRVDRGSQHLLPVAQFGGQPYRAAVDERRGDLDGVPRELPVVRTLPPGVQIDLVRFHLCPRAFALRWRLATGLGVVVGHGDRQIYAARRDELR